MVVWIPKGEFPHWIEKFQGGWKNCNILAYRTELRQNRVIHFENLYRYMYHYITEEGWKAFDDSKEIEPFYGELRNQDGYKEMRIWWRAKKSWSGCVGGHAFFNFKLYLDIFATKMKRIELVYKGKKIRPYEGDVTIWFATVLEIDPQKWSERKDFGGQIYGLLEEYWIRRIYKRNIKDQEVELRRFSARFIDDVKHFINLSRGSETRNSWFQEKQFAF
jgi:hypothetical protein